MRCLVRDRSNGRPARGRVRAPRGRRDGGALRGAGEGVEVAYYLVHAMGRGGDGDFDERERAARRTSREMAREEGVARVVYLGGLGDDRSRSTCAAATRPRRSSPPRGRPLTYFRAAMVVGAGSESYRTLRYLVRAAARDDRAVVADDADPADRDRRRDRLSAPRRPTSPESAGREIQIGGPDVLSYGEMLDRMADALGRAGRAPGSRCRCSPRGSRRSGSASSRRSTPGSRGR